MGANESFWGHNIAGGGGVEDERMKPKPIKVSKWRKVVCNYYLHRFFHSVVPSSFDLHYTYRKQQTPQL